MTIILDGGSLTVDKLVRIARTGEKVELAAAAVERIRTCREMLEDKIKAREIMYGTNTGIGEFSEMVLDDEQVQQFQRYLVYNHSAGIGEPAPIETVRAAMAGRINVQAHGNSGNRPEITLTLVEMLNRGVTPIMCQKGSVGASGDLAPMAQMALVLMGEGEAFYQGDRLPGRVALERAGIPVPGLQARDGLATINGSNVLTAMSALLCYDVDRWLRQAEIACAMSLEALLANLKPYSATPQAPWLRGRDAVRRRDLEVHRREPISRPASSRPKSRTRTPCGPHRAGHRSRARCPRVRAFAGRDRAQRRRRQPDLIPEERLTLTGANFQGTPVSLPMELVGQSVTMVSVLSERRLNRLENPALSQGLPDFLTSNPGFYSGLMLSQYAADSLIVEQRLLSAPASTMSIPAAADQEDFVSMGMNTALKNRQDPGQRQRRPRHRVHGRRPGARLSRVHAGQGRASGA